MIDGDTITYSLDPSMPDSVLFNIDSTTGEVTFKVAPNYEAPVSISSGASSVGTEESDFSSFDQNMLRQYNQYQIKVIGDDGSGESNATTSQTIYIDVRNLPDYDDMILLTKYLSLKICGGPEQNLLMMLLINLSKLKALIWILIL